MNAERRSFAVLRPMSDTAAHHRIRDLVLERPRSTASLTHEMMRGEVLVRDEDFTIG